MLAVLPARLAQRLDAEHLAIVVLNSHIQIFSSVGPVVVDGSNRIKPDVSAPGLNVRSALVGGDYGPGSGTSRATAHVTGVVALLLSARPDLIGDVATVEQIIKGSALPRTSTRTCGGYPGDEIPNPIYGWGLVDALQTLLGDADSDGADNLTDCSPAGAEVWAAPEPVTDLRLDQDGARTSLSWTQPADAGATQVAYDLLRSAAASDFSVASCVLANSTESLGEDSDPVTQIFYYLVRARNGCGENLGAGSDAAPRAGISCS